MFATTLSTLALAALILSIATAAPTPSTPARPYKQIAEWSHPDFFDHFDLYDGPDPTYGFVDYVNLEAAKEQQLMGWIAREGSNTTTAFVGADSSSIAPSGRSSVRLTSKQEFKVGTLAVIDLLHMPVGSGPAGAGLWPAIWFLSPEATWPYGGEIDIVEYVNPVSGGDGTHNAMTLHTGPGCYVENNPSAYLGELAHDDCSYTDSGNTGNIGCGIVAPSNFSTSGIPFATAGPDFNAQGGGVYVAEWTEEGISIWLFNRHILPQDILDRKPNPSKWTQKPLASFKGSCDFTRSFLDMNLIINVDVCGSWAGEVYPGGQEACNAFAAENPEAYKEAYFEFGGILFFEAS